MEEKSNELLEMLRKVKSKQVEIPTIHHNRIGTSLFLSWPFDLEFSRIFTFTSRIESVKLILFDFSRRYAQSTGKHI